MDNSLWKGIWSCRKANWAQNIHRLFVRSKFPAIRYFSPWNRRIIQLPCCYFTVHKNFDFKSSYILLQYTFTKCCFRILGLAVVTPNLQEGSSTMWKVRTNGTGATSNDLNIVPHFVNISQKQRRHSSLVYLGYTIIFRQKNMPKIDRCVKWIYAAIAAVDRMLVGLL